MRFLITGIAGFIGSHTAQCLLDEGNAVVGIDNFNDYYSPQQKKKNIELLKESTNNLKIYDCDLRNNKRVNKIVKEEPIDSVIHLAAMAGVRNSLKNPNLYYSVNVQGTLNILESMRGRVEHLVLASTSSVYGRETPTPFSETEPCNKPLAPYPASKKAAEELVYSYMHQYNITANILRFFTVYGPRGRPDMMAYKILDNIFFDLDVPLYNAGDMYRDWTYVSDVAGGVIRAAKQDYEYEIFNIGRGDPVYLKDFVKYVEEVCGREANLHNEPMPEADMKKTYANIDKAKNKLGYSPSVDVYSGIEKFWSWYKKEKLNDK